MARLRGELCQQSKLESASAKCQRSSVAARFELEIA